MKQIKLPNGNRIYVLDKLTAIDIYKEIFEENIYLRSGIQVKPGDTILDIGGNIGLFSMFISQKVPDLKIYAFEPIPQIFEALKANLTGNTSIAKIENIGLSNEESTAEFNFYPRVCADSTSTPFLFDSQVEMFVHSSNKGIRRIVPKKIKRWMIAKGLKYMYTPIKITCPLKTVSQIISENKIENINLIKLDAENAERQVLEGIVDSDWEKIQQLSIEVHTNIPDGNTLVPFIMNLLKSKGFTLDLDTNSRFSNVGVHMLYATRKIAKN